MPLYKAQPVITTITSLALVTRAYLCNVIVYFNVSMHNM